MNYSKSMSLLGGVGGTSNIGLLRNAEKKKSIVSPTSGMNLSGVTTAGPNATAGGLSFGSNSHGNNFLSIMERNPAFKLPSFVCYSPSTSFMGTSNGFQKDNAKSANTSTQ